MGTGKCSKCQHQKILLISNVTNNSFKIVDQILLQKNMFHMIIINCSFNHLKFVGYITTEWNAGSNWNTIEKVEHGKVG